MTFAIAIMTAVAVLLGGAARLLASSPLRSPSGEGSDHAAVARASLRIVSPTAVTAHLDESFLLTPEALLVPGSAGPGLGDLGLTTAVAPSSTGLTWSLAPVAGLLVQGPGPALLATQRLAIAIAITVGGPPASDGTPWLDVTAISAPFNFTAEDYLGSGVVISVGPLATAHRGADGLDIGTSRVSSSWRATKGRERFASRHEHRRITRRDACRQRSRRRGGDCPEVCRHGEVRVTGRRR